MAVGDPVFAHLRSDRVVAETRAPLDDLADILGHRFGRISILGEALHHPSATPAEGHWIHGYERLEFLGDRVLGLVMADILLHAFPDEDEGSLSRRFVSMVRREALVRVAETIGLGTYLTLSAGEDEAGGRGSAAVLADSCEAVIAALYLDGGLDAARQFITRHWTPLMEEDATPPQDAKTALQEWAQGRGKPLPAYETVAEEGPAHEPEFTVEVHVRGLDPARARGPSKRVAEQAAAAALLDAINGAGRG
jgi:ribonuclease-3